MNWKQDCRTEYAALDRIADQLKSSDWERTTAFHDWSVRDEIMHLLQVDEFGMRALQAPETFPELVEEVRAGQARGLELSARMRNDFGWLDPRALLARWRETYSRLLELFDAEDGERRIPWFGPEMSISSFAIARQMEVWAHGQDILDVLRLRREETDRVFNICDLGVRTQGWSFRNRGLDRPQPPRVSLTGPSGTIRTWNPDAEESIVGLAVDFALVVVQRRHVDDTSLTITGEGARGWMKIAQCFAGAPADGPRPGERIWQDRNSCN